MFLDYKDYTIYNALTWGNCTGHYRKACKEGFWLQRFVHLILAITETFPILSQIISLIERVVAYFFTFPNVLPEEVSPVRLVRRELRPIEARQEILPHRERYLVPLSPSSDLIELVLPENDIKKLDSILYSLNGYRDRMYCALPWPSQIKKIVVMTEVRGGKGDIAAAAKAIAIMQRICPTLTFDWVLTGCALDRFDCPSFLTSCDRSKVHLRASGSESSEKEPGDFLLSGPIKLSWDKDYLENRILFRKVSGPTFGFLEIAEDFTFYPKQLQNKASALSAQMSPEKIYREIHPYLFYNESDNGAGLIPMGLSTGSGILLDRSRIEAPLSRGYCCPSYLRQIQDEELREDILEALGVFDRESLPDFDQHSFNFGYAHRPSSWGKFIDCVAIHEMQKHVVIVLNQVGEFKRLTTEEFKDQIFTSDRLALLQKKGYASIYLKGQSTETILVQEIEDILQERCLTVIVRPSFRTQDMKNLQLAAERLLATGDNTAIESWCARCKLYLYEDVANLGCKWKFLQQQVDLAQQFSPALGRLLALFGGDRRSIETSCNAPLNAEQMREMENLLSDPHLSDATLQFCDHIVANYSFEKVFEAAVKRIAWHYCLPQLEEIETETLDKEFGLEIASYFVDPKWTEKTLIIKAFPELERRVHDFVNKSLVAS